MKCCPPIPKQRGSPEENGINAAVLCAKSVFGMELGSSIDPWAINHRSGQNSSVKGLKFLGSRCNVRVWIDTPVPSGK